ncbi:MAG: hypothetical protein ACI3U1_05755 [Peptococcaceae bacterium]
MAISSKKGMIVTKNAEGKTTSQTVSNVDPAASNENIKTMLQTMGSLQSEEVQELRVVTTEILP